MVHKPYQDWMQELLDGALAAPARRQLEDHLAACGECRATWAALSDLERVLKAEPLAAPRPGFAGRFNARRAQQRTRPRLLWGAAALGLGAVAAAAVVLPLGLGLLFSLVGAAKQPATLIALSASASAGADFAGTIIEALYIAARALLAQPLAWAGAALALLLTAVWLYVMRRIVPKGMPQ